MTEDLFLSATHTLPEVDLKPDGLCKMSGRLLSENLAGFFLPLMMWARDTDSPVIQFNFDLEYLNSSGTFLIVELLRTFEVNPGVEKIRVCWFYEEDDEAHRELGELIESKLDITIFEFIEGKEV